MKIAVGADHAGYVLKDKIVAALREDGHQVLDLGTDCPDSVDYPDYAEAVGKAILAGRAERGIAICGSGAGVSIAANKMKGIRAATVHDCFTAHQAVQHDDLNVLCLGSLIVGEWLAVEIARTFVAARFQEKKRYRRRVEKIERLGDTYLQK